MMKPLNIKSKIDNLRYEVSDQGFIKDIYEAVIVPIYNSTNGNSYVLLENKDGSIQYYILDKLVAVTFEVDIETSHPYNPLTVMHLDGDLTNNKASNLLLVEDFEDWKTITYPGIRPDMYSVSNHGRVKNNETGNILKYKLDKDGYPRVGPYGINTRLDKFVHRFVAWEWVTIPKNIDKLTVNHIDGNKLNNHYLNLEWLDNTMNQRHAWLTGLKTAYVGEETSNSILTNEQVHLICKLIVKHQKKLPLILDDIKNYPSLYNVTRDRIKSIRDKHAWTFISDKYFSHEDFRQRLVPKEAEDICRLLLQTNMDCRETLIRFNRSHGYEVNLRTVQRIKDGELWKSVSSKYFQA